MDASGLCVVRRASMTSDETPPSTMSSLFAISSSVSIPTVLILGLCAVQLLMLLPFLVPLPRKARVALISALLRSVWVAKFLYALKITLIFVGILFVDSANTAYRLNFQQRLGQHQTAAMPLGDDGDVKAVPVMPQQPPQDSSPDQAARKLLSERNLALTTTSLFLAMVLWRVFELNLELAKCQERLAGKDDVRSLTLRVSSRGAHTKTMQSPLDESKAYNKQMRKEEELRHRPKPRGAAQE